MNIGTPELILIVVLAIILYGRRLPEITRALGKGFQEFKKNIDSVKKDFQEQTEDIKTDKYYADASSGEAVKGKNNLLPSAQSETESKNQDKNLAG
jgi:sec-independent protein translocase protein TatA